MRLPLDPQEPSSFHLRFLCMLFKKATGSFLLKKQQQENEMHRTSSGQVSNPPPLQGQMHFTAKDGPIGSLPLGASLIFSPAPQEALSLTSLGEPPLQSKRQAHKLQPLDGLFFTDCMQPCNPYVSLPSFCLDTSCTQNHDATYTTPKP